MADLSKLTISFDTEMSDPTGKHNQFTVIKGINGYDIPLYQDWTTYIDSSVKTGDFPYQYIADYSGTIYLFVSNGRFYDSTSTLIGASDIAYRYILSGGEWVQNETIGSGSTTSASANTVQANSPIFTDATFSTVSFASTDTNIDIVLINSAALNTDTTKIDLLLGDTILNTDSVVVSYTKGTIANSLNTFLESAYEIEVTNLVTSSTFDFTVQTLLTPQTYTSKIEVKTGGSITVDWGDSNSETITTVGAISHTYSTPGTYTISISEMTLGLITFDGDISVRTIETQIPSQFTFDEDILLTWFFRESNITTVVASMFEKVSDKMRYDSTLGGYKLSLFGMFEDSNITSIPTDFLKIDTATCPDIINLDAEGMFSYCNDLVSIGDNLLEYYTIIDNCDFNADSMFLYCYDLETIGTIFTGTFTLILSATEICHSCYSLDAIPTEIFDRITTTATSFRQSFSGCNTITTIPSDLFNGSTNATDAYQMFANCNSVTAFPSGIFDGLPLTNLTACFGSCSAMSNAADDLWNDFPTATSSYCFINCTNLTNYASIPSGWTGA